MTRRLPARRPALVRLRLATGEEYAGSVDTNKGDAEDPFSDAELEAKFMRLTDGSWPPSEAARLRARLLALEGCPDVSALFQHRPA